MRLLPITTGLLFVAQLSAIARSHASSHSGDPNAAMATILLAAAGVVAMVFWRIVNRQARVTPEDVQRNVDEAVAWIKCVQAGQFTPPETPLLLRDGETALLNQTCTLAEARATRYYGGVGTRIKGIYIGGGESESVDSLKEVDSGTLTLTNQRLVFDGRLQNRTADVKQIVSIKGYADAVEVATSKRQKSQLYLVRNPILWEKVIKMVASGDLYTQPKRKPELDVSSTPPKDIELSCPNCGQHLVVDSAGCGTETVCPTCGNKIQVPFIAG